MNSCRTRADFVMFNDLNKFEIKSLKKLGENILEIILI